MGRLHSGIFTVSMAATLCAGAVQAALQLKLAATNYNPVTGTWTDTSGNNNHATQGSAGSRPSLVANQTANGSAAVSFDGADDYLDLAAAIPATSDADGYTVLAYVRPNPGGTLVSGTRGSAEYRGGPKQRFVKTFVVDLGGGNATLSTTSFSSINGKVNDAGGSFRLNGASDGTCSGNTFSPGLTAVGHNDHGNNSRFSGHIAEIRVYDEQLSLGAIQAIEAEFTETYETVTDAVLLPVIDNPAFDDDAYLFVGDNGHVGGGNPAEIASWPGTGGRGINPGDGAGAAFRNNGANDGQVAFIRQGASISNAISGWQPGESYRLAFDYNSRASYAVPGLNAALGTETFTDAAVPAAGGSFAYYTANLLLAPTNGTQVLSISNLNTTEDATLLLDNVRVFRTGPSIADNGFESPVQPDNDFRTAAGGGGGDLSGSAWTMSGGAGISRNRSGFHNTMYASEGEQLGLLQRAGSFVQTVSGFVSGVDYSLSLLTMKRTNTGEGGSDLEVVLDAGLGSEIVLIDIEEVTYAGFTEEAAMFTAGKRSYTLTIRATNPLGGARTTFIDNIWINKLTRDPPPAGMFMLIR